LENIHNQIKLNRSKQIEAISISSFKDIGRILKIRRYREDDYNQMTLLENIQKYQERKNGKEHISNDNLIRDDPADKNKELAEKLEANAKKAKEEEKKVNLSF